MLRPSVLFQPVNTAPQIAGYLDPVFVPPGKRINLSSHELEHESTIDIIQNPQDPSRHSIKFVNRSKGTLEVRIADESEAKCSTVPSEIPASLHTAIAFSGSFRATVSNSLIQGIRSVPGNNESISLEGALSVDNPLLEIFGDRGKLRLSIGLNDVQLDKLFPKTPIPIKCIEFFSLNQDGQPVSSLIDEGEISYPDFPKKDKLTFAGSNHLWLGEITDFRIDGLSLDPQRQGIRVRATGHAPNLKFGTTQFFTNAAPTYLDWVWHRNQSAAIGTAVVVFVSFLLALIEAFDLGKQKE